MRQAEAFGCTKAVSDSSAMDHDAVESALPVLGFPAVCVRSPVPALVGTDHDGFGARWPARIVCSLTFE